MKNVYPCPRHPDDVMSVYPYPRHREDMLKRISSFSGYLADTGNRRLCRTLIQTQRPDILALGRDVIDQLRSAGELAEALARTLEEQLHARES